MSRNSRRNRKKGGAGYFEDGFYQSSNYNQRTYYRNLIECIKLGLNRFYWDGLPDTCDADYLERVLLYSTVGTIAHPKDMPGLWMSLKAVTNGDYNAYGLPITWRAVGEAGKADFEVDRSNGVLVYSSKSRLSQWSGIELACRRLTHCERAQDVNIAQQTMPIVFSAEEEMELELVNFAKQTAGHEAYVAKSKRPGAPQGSLKVESMRPDIPYIADNLDTTIQNHWNRIYTMLGIEHLAFQKGERMIEDEAKGNARPSQLIMMDELSSRRKAADELSYIHDREVKVVFNDDYESYNWIESKLVDGVGNDDGADDE